LDTRGDGSAFVSLGMLAIALGRIFKGRVSGRLVGVHVNMAERLSLFRKAVVIGWARALGLPVVLHLHAAQLPQFYSGLISPLAWLVRWAFAKATRVVVLGEAAQDFVIGVLRVPEDRMRIVINGVPQPSVVRRLDRDAGALKRLLFLGNLSERKGLSDLIAAIAKAHIFQTGAAIATIAGSGDIVGYSAKALAAGVTSKVSFVGWADQQKAASLMADADVLVLPSYDEGLPLVILEALANGVAVICTPVGEIPNQLVNGKEAVFVTPGDVGALARAIDAVLESPETRRGLEEDGRALYERKFSLDQFADSIAEVHRTCFGIASRSPKTQPPRLAK
jgi:glycosyltransferase involved in cell wall biosynthesis